MPGPVKTALKGLGASWGCVNTEADRTSTLAFWWTSLTQRAVCNKSIQKAVWNIPSSHLLVQETHATAAAHLEHVLAVLVFLFLFLLLLLVVVVVLMLLLLSSLLALLCLCLWLLLLLLTKKPWRVWVCSKFSASSTSVNVRMQLALSACVKLWCSRSVLLGLSADMQIRRGLCFYSHLIMCDVGSKHSSLLPCYLVVWGSPKKLGGFQHVSCILAQKIYVWSRTPGQAAKNPPVLRISSSTLRSKANTAPCSTTSSSPSWSSFLAVQNDKSKSSKKFTINTNQ